MVKYIVPSNNGTSPLASVVTFHTHIQDPICRASGGPPAMVVPGGVATRVHDRGGEGGRAHQPADHAGTWSIWVVDMLPEVRRGYVVVCMCRARCTRWLGGKTRLKLLQRLG